jgi:hypothetical protein
VFKLEIWPALSIALSTMPPSIEICGVVAAPRNPKGATAVANGVTLPVVVPPSTLNEDDAPATTPAATCHAPSAAARVIVPALDANCQLAAAATPTIRLPPGPADTPVVPPVPLDRCPT